MVYSIGLLIEVLLLLICLCDLYGVRFRFGVKEFGLVALDMILLAFTKGGYLPDICVGVVYVFLILYGIVVIKKGVKRAVINFLLDLVVMSGLQLLSILVVSLALGNLLSQEIIMLLVYVMMAMLYAVIRKLVVLSKIAEYFQRNDIIMNCVFVMGVILTVVALITTKNRGSVRYGDYVLIAVLILIVFVLAISWFKYKEKALKAEMQLQAYKVYGETFDKLLTDIRMKQHDFQDHINAIYSQHHTCSSLEELVARQKQYCDNIVEDNKYYKLLQLESPVIAGFLYSKFLEAQEKGITVSYDVETKFEGLDIPEYKLVDILGNLINNALDALTTQPVKELSVSIKDDDSVCRIQVSNIGDCIQPQQLADMFKKNYSNKGKHRGLGLYILKTMSKEYGFSIGCCNEIIDNQNWVRFTVEIGRCK